MNNIQLLLQHIDEEWQHLKKPNGFIADLTTECEATHELGSVEKYFKDKKHTEVEAFNDTTRYMPLPLPWMNDKNALYYSQVYLSFFIKNYQDIEHLGNIELSLYYFKTDFNKLDGVTKEQVHITRRIIDFIEEYISEQAV